jgi:hypothetical protein|tara:strand:+ start:482 stop:682 length:201 start_codon:yes stop_codon:yes gene_type:complete
MKELHDKEYYRLIKELKEIKDLLSEILRRLGKLEYSGEVEFGDPYNVGRSKKYINVSLRREKNEKI